MEIVDGYLQLEQLLLHVHYTLTVQLQQGQQLRNAKLGDQHAYQMAQLAYQNQLVHRIQLKLPVEMLELMEHVFGLLQLVQQQPELADFNYVLMQL